MFSPAAVPRKETAANNRTTVYAHQLLCDVAHFIADNIDDASTYDKYVVTSPGCASISAFSFSCEHISAPKSTPNQSPAVLKKYHLKVYAFQITRSDEHSCKVDPWNLLHQTLSALLTDDILIEYHYIYLLKVGVQPTVSHKFPSNMSVCSDPRFNDNASVKSVSFVSVPDAAVQKIGDYFDSTAAHISSLDDA
jgi:hypothetical protein